MITQNSAWHTQAGPQRGRANRAVLLRRVQVTARLKEFFFEFADNGLNLDCLGSTASWSFWQMQADQKSFKYVHCARSSKV